MRTERGVPVAVPFAWESGFGHRSLATSDQEALEMLSKNPASEVAFAPSKLVPRSKCHLGVCLLLAPTGGGNAGRGFGAGGGRRRAKCPSHRGRTGLSGRA